MSFTVKLNLNERAINRAITRSINNAIKKLSPKLLKYARNNHRYQNQTGNLTNSIGLNKLELGLELFADATYAQYIHNGHGTWYPDPWIEDTIKENDVLIMKTIEDEIAKDLNKTR